MSVGKVQTVFLMLLTTGNALGAESRVYTNNEIAALLSPARIEQRKRQIVPTATKPGGSSLTLLKALANTPTGDPLSEFLLHQALLNLDAAPRTGLVIGIIEKLATRENSVFVLLEDGAHASVSVPAFDVAAAAQFKLAHWAETATYDTFSDALDKGEFSLATFRALTFDQRRGVTKAINAAHHTSLAGARSELIDALDKGLPVADLAADAALSLSDKFLFSLALENSLADNLHKQVSRIPASFTPADGLALLKTASQVKTLNSVALLQMANLDATVKPAAVKFLMHKLSEKSSAGSAAAALARLKDPAVNRSLGILLNDKNNITRRGAALALRFEGSDQSTDILRNFLHAPGDHPDLKRDMAKWFAD